MDIIFEDEYVLAVCKPNNILVHHSRMAHNQHATEESLVQILLKKTGYKAYPIHRLDRKTSGIILFAKEKKYVNNFQNLFINQDIEKTYFGLTRGYLTGTGKIDTPVKGRDANIHKDALTIYEGLETFNTPIAVGPYKNSRYSLVKLKPKTGRLHQLRIHLNKINHPLIGDPKYGDRFHNRMFENKFNCKTMFLHAHEINFVHPFTKKTICIVADFPEQWKTTLNQIKKIHIT